MVTKQSPSLVPLNLSFKSSSFLPTLSLALILKKCQIESSRLWSTSSLLIYNSKSNQWVKRLTSYLTWLFKRPDVINIITPYFHYQFIMIFSEVEIYWSYTLPIFVKRVIVQFLIYINFMKIYVNFVQWVPTSRKGCRSFVTTACTSQHESVIFLTKTAIT